MVDVTQHVVVKWNGPSKGSKCSHDQWDRYTCRQLQNRRHHSPFTVTCTHMHQCSHMEPWRKNMGIKHTKYLSIRPMQSSILEPMHLQKIQILKIQGKKNQSLKKRNSKINTNWVKFLIIVIRQFWNTMNLKPVRRLSLDEYMEIESQIPPKWNSKKHIHSEGKFYSFSVGNFQTHIAHF